MADVQEYDRIQVQIPLRASEIHTDGEADKQNRLPAAFRSEQPHITPDPGSFRCNNVQFAKFVHIGEECPQCDRFAMKLPTLLEIS